MFFNGNWSVGVSSCLWDMSEVYGNLGEYGVSSELRDSVGESR